MPVQFQSRTFAQLLAIFALPAASSEISAAQTEGFQYQPTYSVTEIEPADAPDIDGQLTDDVWTRLSPITTFYQSDPVEGAPPSEVTTVFIVHDGANLYIGAVLMYSNQEQITATVRERDGTLWDDDQFRIQFDTYDTKRDAFGFMVNPLGSRYDYIVENNVEINDYWDTLWLAKTSSRDGNWTVEMAVPLQSIPHDQSAEAWGMQIVRVIRQKNEVVRWSTITQSLGSIDMSIAGRLRGVEQKRPSFGLDVQGFAGGHLTRVKTNDGSVTSSEVALSGNIFYRVTPSLTATLTINTDFSNTPLDPRQVNTSRFSLLLPEVREFFLQDAAIFRFGGTNFQDEVNGSPFFSRRIGIVDDEQIGIVAGGKLSGSAGPINIGALVAQVDETATVDRQTLSVVRASLDVLDESRIGLVATHGDPTGAHDNTVLGLDFLYRRSLEGSDRQLALDTFVISAHDAGSDDQAFGLSLQSNSDPFTWNLAFKQIGEGYEPRLGFVNRAGIRFHETGSVFRRRPQDSRVLWATIEPNFKIVQDLRGNTQSRVISLSQCGEFRSSESWCVSPVLTREVITEAFLLAGKIPVPPDDYRFARAELEFKSSIRNPATFSVFAAFGDYFHGTRRDLRLSFESRHTPLIRTTLTHEINRISLPAGNIQIQISSASVNLNFSPEMQFASQIQYDNISRRLAYSGRFSWEYGYASEFFVAANQEYLGELDSLMPVASGLTVRVGSTFRF